jgi:hypothetical protein
LPVEQRQGHHAHNQAQHQGKIDQDVQAALRLPKSDAAGKWPAREIKPDTLKYTPLRFLCLTPHFGAGIIP